MSKIILDDLVKIHTCSELRGLNILLKSWSEVVLDFCKSNDENTCWWYNERATLSTLAGAAWRLRNGWIAIEEFSTLKRPFSIHTNNNKNKRRKSGRCDLYVSHGSTDFAIEAKQSWPTITAKSTYANDKVSKSMKNAIKDARDLTKDEADIRLGISFSAPRIALKLVAKKNNPKQADQKLTREYVKCWLETCELGKYDAWAYIFPKKCDNLIPLNGKNVFPGILLTVKQIKRGHKLPRMKSL